MIISWHRISENEYTIHRVQHTPKIVCLLFILMTTSGLLQKASSPGVPSLHNRLPSASSPWQLKGKFTLSRSHVCELTNWWKEWQHPVWRPSTASQDYSKLTQLQPPNWLNWGLQTQSITVSKCISQLTWWHAASASTNSLDHSLQMHRQIRFITSSKCISKMGQSPPQSVSMRSLDCYFQAHLELLSGNRLQPVRIYRV